MKIDDASGHIGKNLTEELFTLLPLRDIVLFPNTVVPVFVTGQPGLAAVAQALQRDNRLFAVCQKSQYAAGEDMNDHIWPVGTAVRILQHLRLPDNAYRVVLQGEYRGRIKEFEAYSDYALVKVAPIDTGRFRESPLPQDIALLRAVQRSFTQYAELSKKIGTDTLLAVDRAENPERMANLICNSAHFKTEKKV